MARRKTARSMASDFLGSLPLPQALLAYPQDWANGANHTFYIDRRCPFSGLQIENLLIAHGVRVWGKMIVFDDIMITVRRRQAKWAQYLLERAGVPIRPGTEFCASSRFVFFSPESLWEDLWRALEELLDRWGF